MAAFAGAVRAGVAGIGGTVVKLNVVEYADVP